MVVFYACISRETPDFLSMNNEDGIIFDNEKYMHVKPFFLWFV